MGRARRDADRLHDEIQELFSDLWQVPRYMGRHGFRPQVDAYRTGDPPRLTIVVELPGVAPEGIHVTVADRRLVVSGDRPRPRIEGGTWQQMEIEYGSFQRQIALPEDVDPAAATANYDHGLLRIELPVVERRTGPVKVPIAVRTHEGH